MTDANLGDNEHAAEAFALAVRRDPTDDATLFRLALIERLLGRTEDAKRHLTDALELKPDDPTYVNELARTEMTAGEFAHAAKLWDGLEKRAPNKASRKELLLLEAQALQEAHDYAGALRVLRLAHKIDPKDTSTDALIKALGQR